MSVTSRQDETRLREIAERCEAIAGACFDLTAAERLRALAEDVRAVAENLSLKRGVRRNPNGTPD
jgi:hypothetical protein